MIKLLTLTLSKSLISTIEVFREEVELSNTRTAYVMHIPNTLSHLAKRQLLVKF